MKQYPPTIMPKLYILVHSQYINSTCCSCIITNRYLCNTLPDSGESDSNPAVQILTEFLHLLGPATALTDTQLNDDLSYFIGDLCLRRL